MQRQNLIQTTTINRHAQALSRRRSSLQQYRATSRGATMGEVSYQQPAVQVSASPRPENTVNTEQSIPPTAKTWSGDISAGLEESTAQSQPAFTPMTASYQSSLDGIKGMNVNWSVDSETVSEKKDVFLDTLNTASINNAASRSSAADLSAPLTEPDKVIFFIIAPLAEAAKAPVTAPP